MAGEILIIDENPGIQQALKRFLSQNGYSVVAAYNVENAIHLMNKLLPWLVMLDIKMPHGDGIGFINLMKKSNCSIPIIVMTAYPTFFTQEQALNIGVSAYVTKPFDSSEVLKHIKQLFCKNMEINSSLLNEKCMVK